VVFTPTRSEFKLSILEMRSPQNEVTLQRPGRQSAAREMQAQSPIRSRRSAIAKRLLLFDIDGTLIHSGGAGVRALKCALKERFGIDDDLHDIEIAGMTDSGIVVSILNKHEIPATNENVSAFLDSYVHFLSLELPRRKGKLLPGVLKLLKKLKSRPHVVLLSTMASGTFLNLALLPMIIVTATSSGASLAPVQKRSIGGNSPQPRSTSLAILRAILPAARRLAHAPLQWPPAGGAVMNSQDISRIS